MGSWCPTSSLLGHGLMLLLSIAKWCDSQNRQLLVYDGDRQAPPVLLNLLPEGTDLDPDIWLTRYKSIPAFPHRKASASSSRRSFGSRKILGVVHTNVGQKLLNCYPLRVFSCDPFLLFHGTFHDINAIH
jgi:hypothetical protein